MVGDTFISRIRNILNDEETAADAGHFWSDREIILALNASQDVITSFLVSNSVKSALSKLLQVVVYPNTTIGLLPANYLHYVSAQVSSQSITGVSGSVNGYKMSLLNSSDNAKIAQVYIGGESVPFLNVNHSAVFIIGNNIYCQDYITTATTSFLLYYWQRPSYIGATSLGDNVRPDFNVSDFSNDIYNLIANHASTTLAMKEPQTLRDVKFFKNTSDRLGIQMNATNNYLINSDLSIDVIKNLSPKQ